MLIGSARFRSRTVNHLVALGHVYWTNLAPIRNGAGTIGRARLNGTAVNQRFVARKDFRNLHGVAVNPGW